VKYRPRHRLLTEIPRQGFISRRPQLRTADVAWLSILAGVIAVDLASRPTLSQAMDEYLQAHPWLVRAGVALTALHLLNLIPGLCDPWQWVFYADEWRRGLAKVQ
jgi:hypothetical protein